MFQKLHRTMTRILMAAAFGLAITSPAHAITNGGPDGEAHPYVGLAIFSDATGPTHRCTGTLLSPTLFLTAGHCTNGALAATIWFEEDVDAGMPGNGYPFGGPTSVAGTPYNHPNYDPAAFYLYDLGVIVLDTPVEMPEYGQLPELGLLDPWLKRRGLQNTTITAVGYGLQKILPVLVIGERKRLTATLNLIGLRGNAGVPPNTSIGLTNNAKTGGTCFGDSGGPLFLNDTNIVAAVTSFGLNGNCAGTGFGYRVDQSDDLDWIYSTFGDHLP